MKELSFDSGLTTYSLNGKCEVSFNPTDSNFVERLYSAFEDLDKKQESYKAQIEKMTDKREIFEFARAEGIFIENIYNSKVLVGMRDWLEKGKTKGPVCYLHTGGFGSLFAQY